jgi:hypothetical protein
LGHVDWPFFLIVMIIIRSWGIPVIYIKITDL